MEGKLKEINANATTIARKVADEYGCIVAGSLANTWTYKPDDKESIKKTTGA